MNAAQKLGIGCLIGVVALLVLLMGLFVLARRAGDAGPDRLSDAVAMDAVERSTLDAVLQAAGLSIGDFRPVGRLAPLDREENRLAIAIEDGRVIAFSLRGHTVAALPSFSAWTSLETLSLADNGLKAIPDLSGCEALRSVDFSGNRIASVAPGVLPRGVEALDVSGNPMVDIAPLTDLRLKLLVARDCPIVALPEKVPAFPDFRVDLEGCPVANPPGYLSKWDFKIQQKGVAGTRERQSGLVRPGRFEVQGDWEAVPALSTVSLATSPDLAQVSIGPCEVEVSVESGTLRVYLTTVEETRGLWFERGFVKGTDRLIQAAAKIYADATPGKPARLHGNLERVFTQPWYFYVEPIGGEPVRGMKYRVWRD